MNLSELRAHVRSLTGIQSTDILSDADLTIFINEAYQEINREADWPYLRDEAILTTDPGVAQYQLPNELRENNIASIVALANDGNRRQLRPRSRYATDDSPGPTLNGRPVEYSCWRTILELYPTPTTTENLTVRYFAELPNLELDEDEPAFEAKFHSIVAYGAAVRALIREGDETERRSYYNNQFLSGVEQMRGDLLVERDRSLLRIGGRSRIFGRRSRRFGV